MAHPSSIESLTAAVIGRDTSIFSEDVRSFDGPLREAVSGKRVLVIGGGGTIGSITTELLVELAPRALHVVDLSENYLAELVRTIRNQSNTVDRVDLRTLPIDFGGPIMKRFLFEEDPFDVVLNFAALKHVRSEKDVFSLLQMLDTNVVRQLRFKRWLAERGGVSRYFAVSTDKAANPTSLMGASKRLMEDVLFDTAQDEGIVTTSARFANVAFSNGSLLQAFPVRLESRHPLAAPRDTRRYFVSRQEAGEICMLAALCGDDQKIYFPDLNPETELRLLEDVALRVLEHKGFEAVVFDDPDAARDAVANLSAEGKWPLLLTPLDTSGEKPYEEFLGRGEAECDSSFASLKALRHAKSALRNGAVVDQFETLLTNAADRTTKADIVDVIASAVPNLQHIETGRSLDQRV
ncbi:polysaccharide biosynthesis protein [Amorphus coralli]|uniref:polysaccharide biosynthesis protein n=1 Tax=Amorphus coralli TaxID=340680 RepID=UPI00035CFBAA|nr:polysaccharide biosynthesis protein [Amorphus coralli]